MMAGKIPCPKCKHLYPFKTELIGRQVKCKACGQVFRVGDPSKAPAGPGGGTSTGPASGPSPAAPAAGGSLDSLFDHEFDDRAAGTTGGATLGPALPSASTAPSRPAAPGRPRPGPAPLAGGAAQTPVPSGAGYADPMLGGGYPSSRRSQEMTDQDKSIMQAGIYLGAIGMLALILPIFGLRFHRLAGVGEALPYVALGMGIVGSAVAAFGARKNLGLSGGLAGGLLACLLVVYLVSSQFGNSHEAVFRDMLSLLRRGRDALASVEDAETARSAAKELKSIGDEFCDLLEAGADLGEISEEANKRLEEKYKDKYDDLMEELEEELKRVRGIPGAWPILQEAFDENGRKIQAKVAALEAEGRFGSIGSSMGGTGGMSPASPSHTTRSPSTSRAPRPSFGPSPSRGRTSRPPDTPQARVDPKQEMINKHGARYVAELKVQALPDYIRRYIEKKLRKISGATDSFDSRSGDTVTFLLGPVNNVQGLADAVDFGEVTSVDNSNNVIQVRANADKFPPPTGPEIVDPSHPEFYRRNLADLKGYDEARRSKAVERLKSAEPKELREEIAEALREAIPELDFFTRGKAIEAYAVWGGTQAVPDLIQMLSSETKHRDSVVQALCASRDPRAAEPLAALLTEFGGDVDKYLKKMGPMAEDAVLKHLDPNDRATCSRACQVLEVIGTEKSVPALKAIAVSGNTFVDDDAEKAVLAILKPQGEMEQLLLDLELSEGRARNAAERLARMTPDEARRAEVAKALAARATDTASGGHTRASVIPALGVWHTPETFPELVKLARDGDNQVRRAAFEALSKCQTEAAAEELVKLWQNGEDSVLAERALREMGPIAEDPVAALLRDPDKKVRTDACKVLEDVGTRKNLQTLARLARDPDRSLAGAAQRAAQAIHKRN